MSRSLLLAVLILTVCSVQSPASLGHEITAGDIRITHPWARASLSLKARNGVSYITVYNSGSRTDRLIGASTYIADRAELHTHEMKGDVMKMRPVEAVEIPAGGTVEFEPGGLHIMLLGLRTPLRKGMTFPMTLEFESAGDVDVDVVIEAGTARRGGTGHDGHQK